jgi:hypothetical protein
MNAIIGPLGSRPLCRSGPPVEIQSTLLGAEQLYGGGGAPRLTPYKAGIRRERKYDHQYLFCRRDLYGSPSRRIHAGSLSGRDTEMLRRTNPGPGDRIQKRDIEFSDGIPKQVIAAGPEISSWQDRCGPVNGCEHQIG